MKRWLAWLLCAAMLLALAPACALADGEDMVSPNVEPTVGPATDFGDTGLSPDAEEAESTEYGDDGLSIGNADAQPAPPQEIELDLLGGEETIVAAPELGGRGEGADAPEGGLDVDDAIAGYIDQTMRSQPVRGRTRARAAYARFADRFDGADGKLYNLLKAEIEKVAKGERSDTNFTFAVKDIFEDRAYTPQDLGLTSLYLSNGSTHPFLWNFADDVIMPDVGKVMRALMADCPYELYWYDKTAGIRWSLADYSLDGETLRVRDFDTATFYVKFAVAREYAVAGETYRIDVATGQAVKAAAENAAAIVNENAGKADVEKMRAYKNAICDLTDYNYDAANGGDTSYGNPWQLVWVFDGDPDTKVVCEGYAKAFQFLCEQSSFENASVISVTGTISYQSGGGRHMWNIASIAGTNYLVDVTNCDEEAQGRYSDRAFLKGYSYARDDGAGTAYYYELEDGDTLSYLYDAKIVELFREDELELSNNPIGLTENAAAEGTLSTGVQWRLSENGVLYISGNGAIPAFGDDGPPWNQTAVKKATIESGVTAIGAKAFYNCKSLSLVSVPDSVLSVAEDAFEGCDSMIGDKHIGLVYPSCKSPIHEWAKDQNINCAYSHGSTVTDWGKAPTCTQTGLTQGCHCGDCGFVTIKQEVIPATGHSAIAVKGTAATCAKTGLTDGTKCAICGATLTAQKTIAKKAHTPVTVKGTAATCTATGLTDGTKCSVCGMTLTGQKTIAKKAHTPQTVKGYAATCTATGLTDGTKCSACGATLTAQQAIPKKAHTPTTVKGYAATCAKTGLTDGTKCSVCGVTLTAQQTIPKKAHTPVTVKGYDSSCTAIGLTDGSKCSACGVTLAAQQPIPMKAHAPVPVAGYAPTYDNPGLTDGSYCATCGGTIVAQQLIPRLEWPAWVMDKNKNNGTVTISVGEKVRLVPQFAYNVGASVTGFKSGKAKVAAVEGDGLVTALAEGKAKITVTTNNKKQKATVTVNVVDPYKPNRVNILNGKAATISVGQPLQLYIGLEPASAQATLTWTSNKPKVATVDGNGIVYPQGEGKAKITVTTHNKKRATIAITVVDPNKPLGVSIAQGKSITIRVGQTYQLNAALNPAGAQSALTWTSNKPAIAVVDGNGIIAGVKKGKAKITVATYNKKKAAITVNVVD